MSLMNLSRVALARRQSEIEEALLRLEAASERSFGANLAEMQRRYDALTAEYDRIEAEYERRSAEFDRRAAQPIAICPTCEHAACMCPALEEAERFLWLHGLPE